MDMQLTSWAAFKTTCIVNKNLNCQYLDSGSVYQMVGPDANAINWLYTMPKDGGSDQIDFETNYQPAFNWAVGMRPYAFATPDFQFSGDGVSFTATAGTATYSDYKILTAGQSGLYISGGEMYTNIAKVGDYIQVQVVDVDGIMSPAGTVIFDWVKKWYANPIGAQIVDTAYAGKIPGGLYVRVTFNSTGGANVAVAVNYFLHLGI